MKFKDSIIVFCLGILFSFSMFVFTANFNKSSKAASYVEENEYLLAFTLSNLEEFGTVCPDNDLPCVAANFGVTLNNYLYLDYNSFPTEYLGEFLTIRLYSPIDGDIFSYLGVSLAVKIIDYSIYDFVLSQ